MQKRKGTTSQAPPNLQKLPTTAVDEKRGLQLRASKNHPTSQQTPPKASASTPQHHPSKRQKTSITATGQSSASTSKLFCKICMEAKHPTEIFTIKGCRHQFCSHCIGQHVTAKIQENSPSVRCPEPSCKGVLEPVLLQPILAPDVFDRWGRVLCESLILESMKFYCPFKDCSGLLVDERGKDGVVILESECPHCRRLFCAKCKVPWHSGISCDNFQKLGKHERDREDIMLMNLAKSKKWQRCPQCGFYVERIEGCLFMKCRLNDCAEATNPSFSSTAILQAFCVATVSAIVVVGQVIQSIITVQSVGAEVPAISFGPVAVLNEDGSAHEMKYRDHSCLDS
ncbi:hypothetical protein ACLOJK_000971 [Asimina triloba]